MIKLCLWYMHRFWSLVLVQEHDQGAQKASSPVHYIFSEKDHMIIQQRQYLFGSFYTYWFYYTLWHYRLWSFKSRDTKLERFLPKNQHTQRKLLNFENWTNGEPQQLAKIRVFKVDYFILPLFLVPKLRSVAQNEWEKHPLIFFLLLVQK